MKTTQAALPLTPPTPAGFSKFKTVCTFLKNGTCSRTLMTLLDQEFENPMRTEELATDPLAGGLMQGYQCGMLWGSTLAAGAQAHRLYGFTPEALTRSMQAARQLVAVFASQLNNINCLEITETDPRKKWQVFWNFFVKGGTFRCMGRAARFAPQASQQISRALHAESHPHGCNPANCASQLAERMGASQRHIVMTAGLAGGLGLSGGACGALGAAIWIMGIKGRETGVANKTTTQKINQLIEMFLKHTGYEFECSQIVGRNFQTTDEHATFVDQGGCADLVEAIADCAA